MKLSIGVVLDELSKFHIIKHKIASAKAVVQQIRYYYGQIPPEYADCVYLVDCTTAAMISSHNCPIHLIAVGCENSLTLFDAAETVILVEDAVVPYELYEFVSDVFTSYEKWNQELLLSIISSTSVDAFLEIASQKLSNPIAFNDNNMSLIAKAGKFNSTSAGTIWEDLETLGYVRSDFFSAKEYRELTKVSSETREPFIFFPALDKTHTYASSQVWIGGKLYGSFGLIDINAPITDGQLFIIGHITEIMKLYIQNNDSYMKIAENEVSFINNLLKGTQVFENIIIYHLSKLNWKIHGCFYLLSFACPFPLDSPISSMSYVKRIEKQFHNSLITVFEDVIVLIVRNRDYPLEEPAVREKLSAFLGFNEMRCGISAPFPDFSQLRPYYIQSRFALEPFSQNPEPVLQFYEDCYEKHIVFTLSGGTELKSLCHPQILALWSSEDESQRELVRCLYYYLINGRNLASTSEALFIHRNTLIYRLGKISKLLELDLKVLTAEQLFYLTFSCKLVAYI